MKGVYALVIEVKKDIKERIGSLGKLDFPKGIYVYFGSGQKNVFERIKRHFLKEKKKFWHIDYLLSNKFVKIKKVLYKKGEKSKECEMAKFTKKFAFPILKFGCSDCHCPSHLFKIESEKQILFLKRSKNLSILKKWL